MPEQLYCNGKVIFLYNALSPPAKQVVFCFGHLHFSEHEKLQYPQQDKSHNKSSDTHFSWDHCLIQLHFLFFIAFFQRIVSCIILPPVFCYRFPFAPYILTLSSRTLPPFAQILPAPSTLRYTLCPHSATFWQPASAYFPVPVSFLFEFPFSFHELHHALLPVP